MDLTSHDRSLLTGARGEGVRLAMELLVAVGRAQGAERLIDIESAHIDGCLYHGLAGLEFAERLVADGGAVAVPTTLNVASLDLLHPDLYRGDPDQAELARRLMDAYVALGCRSTWTCAPYQLIDRPGFGAQIAWGESNAIVFANSVLGARTNRYGDFMDICCALTGRAPFTDLHTDEGRRATVVVDLALADELLDRDLTYVLIGHVLGRVSGVEVPAIVGLDGRATEDRLKALGAASASSGSVALFHAVGVTPEAETLDSVVVGPTRRVSVTEASLKAARTELTTATGELNAVSLGTPHMSLSEMTRLADLVAGLKTSVPFYVNTGRDIYAEATGLGLVAVIETFGGTIITDTCAYLSPVIGEIRGHMLTDSGKAAYYAPANLGVEVSIASLEDCVASAVAGKSVVGEW